MIALSSRPPKPWTGTSFDTETYQGWARIICTPDSYVELPRGGWRQAFRFLLDHGPCMSVFNLRFDAEAILKHLPLEALRSLLALERLDIQEYRVDLIPWKMLRISDGRQTVEIFDVQPFFASSLDVAAKKFLGVGKEYHGVDPAKLNTDPDAWRNMRDIIAYCQVDALRTDGLTHYMAERYNELGASFHRPFSVAFVAADALVRESVQPKLAPRMKKVAEQAYYGGWFDCMQRGEFDRAHLYDIKAAYPSYLVRIEDSAKSRWVESTRPHKDALHAVVRVRAHLDPDDFPHIAPLPFRRSKSRPVIYPTGSFETTVLLDTYRKFEEHLTALESWSQIPQGTIFHPYKRTVSRLVAFRDNTSDAGIAHAAKGGTNALYGKTLNTRMDKVFTLADPRLDHFKHDLVMMGGQQYRVERVRREGMLYNPLHAGLTTEAIRLQVWDAVARHPSDCIMVMTDGFLSKRAVFRNRKARKMGDWDHVASGRLVSCGSGLYEMEGYGSRTRGVTFGRRDPKLRNTPGPSGVGEWTKKLRSRSDVKGTKVRFKDVRPAHLAECLSGSVEARVGDTVRTLGVKDANVFVEFTRWVDVTRDDKRVWPTIPTARHLLGNRYVSRPVHIEESP